MVSNLGKAIDKMLEKSEIKGKLSMVTEMLRDGDPIEKIVRYSKLGEKEIMELKTKLFH